MPTNPSAMGGVTLLLQKGKFAFFAHIFGSESFPFLGALGVPVLVPFNHLFSLNSPNSFDGDDDDDDDEGSNDDDDDDDDDDDLSPPDVTSNPR